ncbi:MAG TPA: potassium-transporting ATPase subunit KdpC [Deinococcales bacterium]|nr:potassium-transporting ATPase subunit KdpC [Deinococcales bacterium]
MARTLAQPLPARPQPAPDALDSRGGPALTWLRFALAWLALAGLAYPALGVLLGQALFPWQAQGSLIEYQGRVAGSRLIGQAFTGPGYFTGRPSAAAYDPRQASGSNLAASNPALRQRAQKDAAALAARLGVPESQLPVDLIAASGSGLDPQISPAAAEVQAASVARARGMSLARVQALIAAATERGPLGLGQPGVNVLRLNLALDGR